MVLLDEDGELAIATPSVDGLVNMMPAVLGPTIVLRASISTSPFGSVGISLTARPHITAEAGFVPWAEVGIKHTFLLFSRPWILA